MSDRSMLVAVPATEAEESLVESLVPGSILIPCVQCAQPCWVSPSGQETLARGTEGPLCVPCSGVTSASAADLIAAIRHNPRVLQELLDAIKRKGQSR